MSRTAWLLIATCALPGFARAAPFCVQTQSVGPQCIYFDARSCQSRATTLRGSCVVNPADIKLRNGIGGFCLVDSYRHQSCQYASLESCLVEAQRLQAACITAPFVSPSARAQDAQSTPATGGLAAPGRP